MYPRTINIVCTVIDCMGGGKHSHTTYQELEKEVLIDERLIGYARSQC